MDALFAERPELMAWPADLVGAILGGKRNLRKLATMFVEWAARTSVERFGTEQLQEGYRRILAAAPERRDVVAKQTWFEVGAEFEKFAVSSPGSAFLQGYGPSFRRVFVRSPDRAAAADNVAHGLWLTTLDQSIVGAPGEALRYFAMAGLTWQEQAARLVAIIAGPWEETERSAKHVPF
jgi:hypothetical protein